jgi:hypothetical protein
MLLPCSPAGLLQRVQASEAELRAELAARGAFSWNKDGRSGSGKSGSSGEKENGGDDDERIVCVQVHVQVQKALHLLPFHGVAS